MKALAFDLIKLYAQRKSKPGFAFQPDNYLQHELEASFIYEDTPDQNKATQDVKRDMEKSTPMDRLGDQVMLPEIAVGDVMALFMAGAYGASASPADFLGHPHAREIVLDL